MSTTFKLNFESKPDIDVELFRSSLSAKFHVEEKEDGIYVRVNSESTEDERCQYLIDRELDRHFFLTSVKITATMIRTRVCSSLNISYRIHGNLPEDISPQNWTYNLTSQLRLWSIAVDHNDPLTKLLLLFQIIEIAYPEATHYPEYNNPEVAPHPLSECKFIRHLIAHSGDVKNRQLKNYCAHLGIPEIMLDMTDDVYQKLIISKLPLMQQEAEKIIKIALTI